MVKTLASFGQKSPYKIGENGQRYCSRCGTFFDGLLLRCPTCNTLGRARSHVSPDRAFEKYLLKKSSRRRGFF